jgi:hypothetical protein
VTEKTLDDLVPFLAGVSPATDAPAPYVVAADGSRRTNPEYLAYLKQFAEPAVWADDDATEGQP